MLPSTEHVLDVPRARLAYSRVGKGPLVLHAHGLGCSRAVDRRLAFVNADAVAAAGFEVVSFDARGHGASTGTPVAADCTWPALADDLLALADHLSPHAPVHAIGLSMGTGALLHAACRRPDRFRQLVLAAPPTAWDTRPAQAKQYRALADLVDRHGPAVVPRVMAHAPVPPLFADLPGYPPLPDIEAGWLTAAYRGAAASDLPAPEPLKALQHPVLLLGWATDPGHPVSTTEALQRLLPNACAEVAATRDDLGTWPGRIAAFLGDPLAP